MRRTLLGALLVTTLAPWVAAQYTRPVVLSRLLWFDRDGQRLGALGPVADHGNLELSPDGRRVAVAVADRTAVSRDIWMYDVASDGQTRFTSDAADENWSIWSPDGARVLLNSFAPGRFRLIERPAAGTGRWTERLDNEGRWPVSWSPDGRFVLFVTNSERTNNDIWVLPLDTTSPPYPFLRTEEMENWATFSPDGRWVAFSATVSGRAEVFVSTFPPTERRWRVSAEGGSQARWRRDGEILYIAPTRMLMAASVSASGTEFAVTRLEELFQLSYPYGAYHAFDVTRDGSRLLVNTFVVNPTERGLSVTLQRGSDSVSAP
jgi:dipeptidyl aminopeptidase/acylaminoacyl peptidase